MEVPESFQKGNGRPLPNQFRRGLDSLEVNYPGYENDMQIAQEAIDLGSKEDFLKAFRTLKGKQIAHDHCQEVNGSTISITDELNYPGNEADKRELQSWFLRFPPTEENVKKFMERIEGLRNKNAATQGDRSHPHIAALLELELSYPGCEEDVQEALQAHYSRPRTRFPEMLHSLKAKQDLFQGNRSHWRLRKLDDLELTYPKWEEDAEAVVDWHIHNSENRESSVLFHEIIDGMLEKEVIYLEWKHQRRLPKRVQAGRNSQDEYYINETSAPSKSGEIEDYNQPGDESYECKGDRESSSFSKYYVDEREEHNWVNNERSSNCREKF